jgi:hypothetical protein
MLKRIIYTDKEGNKMDIVARIIKKKSKVIIIKPDDYDYEIAIPRGAVDSIADNLVEKDDIPDKKQEA